MRIYADPTELSSASRLPKNVAEVAIPLPHLEEATGADLLLSILSIPCSAESEVMLKKHTESGMLIQLKRRDDLLASIQDQRLFYEIFKMKQWTPRPWLVVTGMLLSSGGGAVIAEPDFIEASSDSDKIVFSGRHGGMMFSAVDAAMDAFAYYGGYTKFIQTDDYLFGWLERQEKALLDIQAGKVRELAPRQAQKELIGPTKVSWLASLFNGVGQKTSRLVFDRLQQLLGHEAALWQAIGYLTNYQASEIPGITQNDVQMWREFLGLPSELKNDPALYATIGLEWRLQDTGEVYWHNIAQKEHYRNDGSVDRVYTPTSLNALLGKSYQVNYKNEEGHTLKVCGNFDQVSMDGNFEWLHVGEVKVRLDRIESIELMEETNG